jgi:hypothetical protein
MRLINRIEQIGKLWATMLPHIPAPDPAWLGRWCAQPDEVVEHAIIRTSKKFSLDKIDTGVSPEVAWRYASGVVTSEGERLRATQNKERKRNLNTQSDFTKELDVVGERIDKEGYSTELGEIYLDVIERFLRTDPSGFFAWADGVAGRHNPVATRAVRLLRTGKVTSATTFGDLPGILAAND